MNFNELLSSKEFIILDGAMGTMLQSKGMKAGEIPELLNITSPQWIYDIHKSYIDAGADIIYANTFGANRLKLEHCGKTPADVIVPALDTAKKAADGKALAALDIGPIGQLLEPAGSLSFEDAYDIFKEQIEAGGNADIIVIETMTDLLEAKAALLAAKENSDLPVMCTMSFEQNGRTFVGVSPEAMAMTLSGLGADAVGVNCSLGPRELYPIVKRLSEFTELPVICKPNAGLPDPETGKYDVTPEEFAESAAELAKLGVKIFGGCCGTDPEFIRALVKRLSSGKFVRIEKNIPAAVCSGEKAVIISEPRIIGERINPTGKKRFKEALMSDDTDYILGQAVEQAKAGADILDVNVGLPDIDERAMMIKAVKGIQSVADLPLQIDSTDPAVIESALRVYNGKAIVNSVNGEEKSLRTILPIVKKYGAAVVGLTLDENGIPKKAEDRFKIAEKILERALAAGIPKRDVFIDCLTLTASAEQSGVMETVKAVNMVKTRLGLKTVLGVSNISFGLPNRELVSSNFLTMCLTNGLDLPIINPNAAAMTGAVRAYKLLTGIDENCMDYIKAYNSVKITSSVTGTGVSEEKTSSADGLSYAVENGLKSDAAAITRKMLESVDAMEIVDKYLIPSLDKTGAEFEKGKIFLPQLILSADAAQSCFEEIKKHLSEKGGAPAIKGKVVLATVKGDVHDIGKNIVKVLLDNYGYKVIDLGKDVDPQLVLKAAVEHDVRLVGLSALMTTTLGAMEETVKLLHDNNVNCKIVVGGAVLTPEYAKKIGADYYAKDANETVAAAKEIYG